MSEDKLYTLDEAKRALAAQECAYHGHRWDTVSNMAGEIVTIFCDNQCGEEPVFGKGFEGIISTRYTSGGRP